MRTFQTGVTVANSPSDDGPNFDAGFCKALKNVAFRGSKLEVELAAPR